MGPKLCLKTRLKIWTKDVSEQERSNFELDGQSIFCNACSKRFANWSKKSQLEQHIETDFHKKSVSLKTTTGRQSLVSSQPLVNDFNNELCAAFLSADIPWAKLNDPVFKSFLEKHMKRIIPSTTTLQTKCLKFTYQKIFQDIQTELANCRFWLAIDETTDACGRFIVNVVVGGLTGEPSKPHLLMSREVATANNVTITQFVSDALHLLLPGKREAEIGQQFTMLLSDAARYMVKAGANLKILYPNLIHVTCLAHGLHRVAETVRDKFKNVDKLLASVKAVFKKATSRKRKYKEAFPELPLPPETVLTRWGSWLEASCFIAANYSAIKQVISGFSADDAECIRKAQILFERVELRNDLAVILANYSFLPEYITKLEERNMSLIEATEVVNGTKERLEQNTSLIGKAIVAKLDFVLKNNPGFEKVRNVAQVLQGNSGIETDLDPHAITCMKYCPITSVEVERSFSMHKSILTDRRESFKVENLEMDLICHYELKNTVK